MMSNARLSPKSRSIADVEARIARLTSFEEWAKCAPIRIEEHVNPEMWAQYYRLQDEILEKMREAQRLALGISKSLNAVSP